MHPLQVVVFRNVQLFCLIFLVLVWSHPETIFYLDHYRLGQLRVAFEVKATHLVVFTEHVVVGQHFTNAISRIIFEVLDG